MQFLSLWNSKNTQLHFNEENDLRYFPIEIEDVIPWECENEDGTIHEDADVEQYFMIFDNQTGTPIENPYCCFAELPSVLKELNGVDYPFHLPKTEEGVKETIKKEVSTNETVGW